MEKYPQGAKEWLRCFLVGASIFVPGWSLLVIGASNAAREIGLKLLLYPLLIGLPILILLFVSYWLTSKTLPIFCLLVVLASTVMVFYAVQSTSLIRN